MIFNEIVSLYVYLGLLLQHCIEICPLFGIYIILYKKQGDSPKLNQWLLILVELILDIILKFIHRKSRYRLVSWIF